MLESALARETASPRAANQEPILILGQGLAGTLLAWQLHWLGQRVLILDREEADTSSKVAAGIVTPITGKRVALSHEVDAFLPEAAKCYERLVPLLGARHFHPLPQVRLFQNDTERARFAEKRGRPEFARHLTSPQPSPLAGPDWFHGPLDGFEMRDSGWLDTRAWLSASAAWFAARGEYRRASVRHEDVVLTSSGGMAVAGIAGSALVFCEGHAGAANPWFSWLKWKSAKGEILSLSIPALAAEKRIINRGGWLLPTGDGGFRSGATYAWDNLNSEPTEEAGNVLRHRLQNLLRVPWEVTGHQAAVRPILHQSLAKMGRHPSHPALVFFNGLGSKGVLHGPRYARMLAENLVSGEPLPDQLDVAGNH